MTESAFKLAWSDWSCSSERSLKWRGFGGNGSGLLEAPSDFSGTGFPCHSMSIGEMISSSHVIPCQQWSGFLVFPCHSMSVMSFHVKPWFKGLTWIPCQKRRVVFLAHLTRNPMSTWTKWQIQSLTWSSVSKISMSHMSNEFEPF